MSTSLNGGTEAPRGRGRRIDSRQVAKGVRSGGRKAGIGAGGQVGLGHQLTRRVQSGAITQSRAQQTAQQRQVLTKAFGSNWREKLGGAGAMRQARTAAQGGGFGAKADLAKLLQKRQQLLATARGKGKGGRVNPRGRGMMNPPGQG
jgi:hypothetical protein